MKIDFGKLIEEETVAIAKQAIGELSDRALCDMLAEAVSKDNLEEAIALKGDDQ